MEEFVIGSKRRRKGEEEGVKGKGKMNAHTGYKHWQEGLELCSVLEQKACGITYISTPGERGSPDHKQQRDFGHS